MGLLESYSELSPGDDVYAIRRPGGHDILLFNSMRSKLPTIRSITAEPYKQRLQPEKEFRKLLPELLGIMGIEILEEEKKLPVPPKNVRPLFSSRVCSGEVWKFYTPRDDPKPPKVIEIKPMVIDGKKYCQTVFTEDGGWEPIEYLRIEIPQRKTGYRTNKGKVRADILGEWNNQLAAIEVKFEVTQGNLHDVVRQLYLYSILLELMYDETPRKVLVARRITPEASLELTSLGIETIYVGKPREKYIFLNRRIKQDMRPLRKLGIRNDVAFEIVCTLPHNYIEGGKEAYLSLARILELEAPPTLEGKENDNLSSKIKERLDHVSPISLYWSLVRNKNSR